MTINFKLEYNLEEALLRIIDGNSQGEWISHDKTDKFNNPIFELGKKYGWCSIRLSRNEDWLIMLIEHNNTFYNSFQRNDSERETFFFSKFEEVQKVDGRWEKVNSGY